MERTGLAEEQFPVGLIGSVFRSGEVFTGPLRRRILQAAPGALIAPSVTPPVAGSLLLAARLAGRSEEVGLEQLERVLDDATSPASQS